MAPYEFRDPFLLGHGEKSLFLLTRHMALTAKEALAIRWQMGAYGNVVKGGSRSMTEALNMPLWVWHLQETEMRPLRGPARNDGSHPRCVWNSTVRWPVPVTVDERTGDEGRR